MKAVHFIDGSWQEGNPAILGPMTHATWMASVIFDGARAFEGVTPDLDLHCERTVASAISFGLKPIVPAGEILEIAREGVSKFSPDAELYIRPMLWAETGFVAPDPESTRFCLSVFEAPMPDPKGMGVQLSSFRRPLPSMAPTQAKAACLYPNSGRALREALDNGFDNAVVLDGLGNVAELATANIWIAKDGAAHTPAPNGTFLNGITRQRVGKLLQDAGIPVYERCITWEEVMDADEAFSSGNHAKVVPITRIGDRNLQMGPIYQKARELYWNWAHGG
ncbi:branched-chain amino acid aminotransferase [Pelagibius sp. Alg239-R121]|uniref:branched-chain amino acid aminotransferase n=1 Tax=Pelagibius sp. Alg239-R121 TaxID=2993448 RepID=UPI0024A70BB2|nr:branched-chain amino acid aminotransferase [Pelagibius sp. Alg239-R121]